MFSQKKKTKFPPVFKSLTQEREQIKLDSENGSNLSCLSELLYNVCENDVFYWHASMHNVRTDLMLCMRETGQLGG